MIDSGGDKQVTKRTQTKTAEMTDTRVTDEFVSRSRTQGLYTSEATLGQNLGASTDIILM